MSRGRVGFDVRRSWMGFDVSRGRMGFDVNRGRMGFDVSREDGCGVGRVGESGRDTRRLELLWVILVVPDGWVAVAAIYTSPTSL